MLLDGVSADFLFSTNDVSLSALDNDHIHYLYVVGK